MSRASGNWPGRGAGRWTSAESGIGNGKAYVPWTHPREIPDLEIRVSLFDEAVGRATHLPSRLERAVFLYCESGNDLGQLVDALETEAEEFV